MENKQQTKPIKSGKIMIYLKTEMLFIEKRKFYQISSEKQFGLIGNKPKSKL